MCVGLLTHAPGGIDAVPWGAAVTAGAVPRVTYDGVRALAANGGARTRCLQNGRQT